MNFQDFADCITDAINEEIAKQSEVVANNSASDFADYRFRTGQIRGLKKALDLVPATVRAILEEDDDG